MKDKIAGGAGGGWGWPDDMRTHGSGWSLDFSQGKASFVNHHPPLASYSWHWHTFEKCILHRTSLTWLINGTHKGAGTLIGTPQFSQGLYSP